MNINFDYTAKLMKNDDIVTSIFTRLIVTLCRQRIAGHIIVERLLVALAYRDIVIAEYNAVAFNNAYLRCIHNE